MTAPAFAPPPALRPLLATAHELLAGAEGYVVGGSLRDALAGRPLADLDLAVAGDAPALARRLADRLGGHFVLLDVERGIARVALDEGPVRYIDVAALRGSIQDDLSLRDFTIDALAARIAPLAEGRPSPVIDPFGGAADLERGLVRMISAQALEDDPLRLLRAVRLCAELGFQLEPETAEAIRSRAGLIGQAAAERRRDELARCFATPRAAEALRLMDGLGLLDRLFPEVAACRGVPQPKEHYWDVFDHLIETVAALDLLLSADEPAERRAADLRRELWRALDAVPDVRAYLDEEMSEGRCRAVLLKLAGLLHDVAKPETRAPDATGRIRFFGHAELGAAKARSAMRRLRFSRRETDFVAMAVEEHLRPGQLGGDGPPSRRALYRFFRDTGEAATAILLLSLADHLAARGPRLPLEDWRGNVAYIAWVLTRRHEEEAIVRPPRLLSGHDIMSALGIGPGRQVGWLLAALEEAQAAGEVSDREQALNFIRRWHGSNSREPALSGSRP